MAAAVGTGTVEELERKRDELRAAARQRLAMTGHGGRPVPLRDVLREQPLGGYPLFAIGLLAIVDQFQGYGFSVLAPEISATLGVGAGVIATLIALKTIALAVAPLPMAALGQRHARRALLCIVTAIAWSVFSGATAFAISVWGLAIVLVADGLSTGSVAALHQPLLLDYYPPEGRVRMLTSYQAFVSTGNIISPLLVATLASVAGFTWRGVFLVLGAVSLLASLVSLRLRDPGVGRFDTNRIRELVREGSATSAASASAIDDTDVTLGFFEIVRRLMLIPTVRRLLTAYAVLGTLLVPYQTFLFFFLADRWRMGPGERGVFFAFTASVSVVALAWYARRGEAMFQRDPGRVVRLTGLLLAVAVVLISLGALSPWFFGMVALFAASAAVVAIVLPSMVAATLSVIPAAMRPHAAALSGIFLGGAGGLLGAIFLSGIGHRYGTTGSIVSLLVPGAIGAAILASAGRLVGADIDRMIDEVIEDEEIQQLARVGRKLPMLACRGIDFSYGQLQVLFDVDLTVDDGEMVALLGVNGAGKSTLLKVISGIGLPSRGSVRFRGLDITYLDAERRLQLGVTQVPGGRAVFGDMTVVENLRSFGYSVRRDGRRLETGIDRAFDAFPRLVERRGQLASTLSGGEQQMLGIAKALILQPRLLLIDELSLGLAPVVVSQLLDIVREINQAGTAVVLVEQSVNIALGLVDHAYFMEKGEVRFDGRAKDLLRRDDLLRAVFLEGAPARSRGPVASG